MAFQSNITEQGRSVIFQLSGKLINEADVATLNQKVDAALQNDKKFVVFSLENLTHCNSTGINLFIRSLTKSRIKGGDTYLAQINESLNELFRQTRINEIFNIYASLEEVLQHIQSNNT
jgi:anti-anti-sigma factor